MRHFSAFACLLLLLACCLPPARAQSAADTIPGQARFVRQLTATLCERIADSARMRPFEQLTPAQADRLFMRLLSMGMSEQAPEFQRLLQAAQERRLDTKEYGRSIGVATVTGLSAACPSSMALVIRTSTAQRAAGANAGAVNNISAAERAQLQPLADSVCAQLAARDVRSPFQQLSPAARKQQMGEVMQLVMLRNMPLLLGTYSAEQLEDEAEMQRFGIKLASLMATQCPSYLMAMGVDGMNEKRAAARRTAAPKAPARPATKASARKPALKGKVAPRKK